MNTAAKLGIGCGALAVVASVGLVFVAPALVRQASEVVGPIQRVKRSQAALDEMVDEAAWRKPERDALAAEQLDRFFAVRARVEEARRNAGPHLDVLPRKNVRSLEELKQVPGIIRDVTGVVGAEMEAFVEVGMPPAEYHWIERLVYERWRGALKRAGVYPVAARAAAAELDSAAARERDARVRARLEGLAGELRARPVPPPEGFVPEVHELLLARIDDVERHSLDDVVAPYIPVPR
jgi:hypothetical protein